MAPAIRFVVGGWYVVLSTHALMFAVAVVVGALVAVRRARDPVVALAWAPVVATAALGGGRLLYVATHGGAIVGATGLSSMGGVVAVVVVLGVAAGGSGRRFADLADAFAPAGVVALGIGRLGCFLAGCCWGRPTDLPWGVVLPELGPAARHPVQLYSAVLDAALGWVLLRTRRPPGVTAAYVAIGLGAARLALETVRDPAAADALGCGLRLAQAGGVVLLIAGGAAVAWLRPAPTCPCGPASPAGG